MGAPEMFSAEAIAAIQADAMARYPRESCGLVTAAGYQPFPNIHPTPETQFEMPAAALARFAAGEVLAVVHSHPDGPLAPSAEDQRQQIATALPWGIVSTDGVTASAPLWWGDGIPDVPIEGRDFRWGPSGTDGKGDCYALVRDWYRRERGLLLRDYARDAAWQDEAPLLYQQGWQAEGFRPIAEDSLQPGDAVLFAIRSQGRPNHAGVYLGQGLLLHHLENRLAERTTLAFWRAAILTFLRPPT